jgi:hypothetical protein
MESFIFAAITLMIFVGAFSYMIYSYNIQKRAWEKDQSQYHDGTK